MALVRICPNCSASNPPGMGHLTCNCGYPLDNVDPTPEGAAEETVLDGNINATETHPLEITNTPATINTISTCDHVFDKTIDPVCPYCPPADLTASSNLPLARIDWPWGETETIGGTLTVGREPPATARLAARLESQYGSVSRRHAEFVWENGHLSLRDMNSTNGTFVNDQRIAPQQLISLAEGDRVRFAAKLEIRVRIGSQA